MKFEFIEHTADVGLRAYGKTIEDVFANAAYGLFTLLVPAIPRHNNEKNVCLEAPTQEDLFITWLNELLSIYYAEKTLPCRYKITISDSPNGKVLQSIVMTHEFDPYASKVNMEIKAATYHELKVEKTENGWVAQVIFDV